MPTKQQWMRICTEMLGLRSATSDNDLAGASYALDDGVKYTFGSHAPGDWDAKLEATLREILAFPNAAQRRLLLVQRVTGTSSDCVGCLEKCSSHARSVVDSVALAGQTASSLQEWVLGTL